MSSRYSHRLRALVKGLVWHSRSSRGRLIDLRRHADSLHVPDASGRSGAIVRSGHLSYDIGEEFDSYGTELKQRERSAGLADSRTSKVSAAQQSAQADAARLVTGAHATEVERATAAYTKASDDLLPYVRRRGKDRTRYWAAWWVLWLGDSASVLAAAVYLGEIPVVAGGMAVSAGMAAVSSGLVGADVREYRLAKERASLVEAGLVDQAITQRYPRLFAPASTRRAAYGLALTVGLLITVLLGIAVFVLRASIEGSAGAIFGALAVATSLASYLNAWAYADDVADVLSSHEKRMVTAAARHQHFAGVRAVATQDRYAAEAAAIVAEHEMRATADEASVKALKFGVFRQHPEIFGHATADFRGMRLVSLGSEPTQPESNDDGAAVGIAHTFQPNGRPPL